MKNIKITDLNQFNSLLDLIHDEYFDMEITKIDIDSNDIEIKGKSRIGTFLFVCDSSTGKIYE